MAFKNDVHSNSAQAFQGEKAQRLFPLEGIQTNEKVVHFIFVKIALFAEQKNERLNFGI